MYAEFPSALYDPQLVIPSTFEECLTYEMQVMWLYNQIQNIDPSTDPEAIKKLQAELDALAVKVTENTTNISNNSTDITEINETIASLRMAIESLDTRVNTAVSTSKEAREVAQSAEDKATTATTTANEAKTTADGLATSVNEAKETATTAKETADTASITATEAKTTADGLATDVTEAKTEAESARATARDAQLTSQSASTTATEASSKADTALDEISTVQTTLNAVSKKADDASTTAITAKETADTAKSTADTASATATEAKSTAGGLVTAVNEVKETADTAKSTADAAQLQANRANTRATTALTTAEGKQDKLTAGDNITISDANVISATGAGSVESYYDIPKRPVLQEIDISEHAEGLQLDSLEAGLYRVISSDESESMMVINAMGVSYEVGKGFMFVTPSVANIPKLGNDAVLITPNYERHVVVNYDKGESEPTYAVGFISSEDEGLFGNAPMRVLTINNVSQSVTSINEWRQGTAILVPSNIIGEAIDASFDLASSSIMPSIPIPLFGGEKGDPLTYTCYVHRDGRFAIHTTGTFGGFTAGQTTEVQTIEIGPTTANALYTFSSYNFNPPDHVVVYNRTVNTQRPYAMYWYDKTDEGGTYPWSWVYKFNKDKSVLPTTASYRSVIEGTPELNSAVEAWAIF